MRFLKIENPGVCDTLAMTLLGGSTSHGRNDVIGRFGTGFSHSVALLSREGLRFRVYVGRDGFEVYAKSTPVKDVTGCVVDLRQMYMKKIGTRKETPLGFGENIGINDWTEVGMAIRELVSNAVDSTVRMDRPISECKISIVEEHEICGTTGKTRVYVEAASEVRDYFARLGENFIMFRPGYDKSAEVIRKPEEDRAKVYRKGVKVGELMGKSNHDFNFKDIEINEQRTASPTVISARIAQAARSGCPEIVKVWMESLGRGPDWALGRINQGMFTTYYWCPEEEETSETWRNTFDQTHGPDAVACEGHLADTIKNKGYKPVVIGESLIETFRKRGIRTQDEVLTGFEAKKLNVGPPTESVERIFEEIWEAVVRFGHSNGAEKPNLVCFDKPQEGGSRVYGYSNNGTIGINRYIADGDSNELWSTILEEIGHHVTKENDCTRGFQTWLCDVAVSVLRSRQKLECV